MNEDTVLRYRITGLKKNKINHNKWLSRTIMSGSDSKDTVASMPLCLLGLSQTCVADVFKNISNVVHLINFLWKRYEVDLTYRTTHRTQCVTDHILTRYYRWWNHHNTQKLTTFGHWYTDLSHKPCKQVMWNSFSIKPQHQRHYSMIFIKRARSMNTFAFKDPGVCLVKIKLDIPCTPMV